MRDRETQAEHLGDSERTREGCLPRSGLGFTVEKSPGYVFLQEAGEGVLEGEPWADTGRRSTNRPRRCQSMPASPGFVWGPGSRRNF